MLVRTAFTVFCFLGYYWSENPEPVQVSFFRIGTYPIRNISNSGLIFFLVGLSILILSAALTYVLHIQTRVYHGYMLLDGFRTSRRIKIDLNNIVSVRKSRYKKNIWRRAVYNLYNKGVTRFYASGEDFVELTDNAGFTYKIGSQKPTELYLVLKNEISEN